MAIIARDTGKRFKPAPEGLHVAVCVDVVDLGEQETPWGNKPKVDVRWEIDAPNEENEGRPHLVMKRYTISLAERATLRAHLEAWRGRKFTAEELDGFDLEKLVGACCQIQVAHNIADDGRVWANVQAIVPLGKGMEKIAPSADYVRVRDRPDARGTGGEPMQDDDMVPF